MKQSTATAFGVDPKKRSSSAINMMKFKSNFNQGKTDTSLKPMGPLKWIDDIWLEIKIFEENAFLFDQLRELITNF